MSDVAIHRVQVRVRYGDTDAAGIVYHANYLRYFEIGRAELMRDWVCSYKEIEKLGILLPVTECYTRFKAPARYDDLLTIETWVAELTRYSCKFSYRITCDTPDGQRPRLLVKGYTVNASIDTAGNLTPVPDEIMAKMAALVKKNRSN